MLPNPWHVIIPFQQPQARSTPVSGERARECVGAIDGFDIDPFALILLTTEPYDEYYAQYPNCDHILADTNGDDAIDGFDIDPFVALMLGGG